MKPSRAIAAILLLCIAPTLTSCAKDTADEHRVLVFAASSLTAAFQELAEAFEARHPGWRIDLHCAGTPQLVMQIRERAPVDVFASADPETMQRAIASCPTAQAPVTFARNRLTIITSRGNPKHVRALTDLSRSDLRVALCGPDVPAGRYARRVLANAGITIDSVSDEPSVRALASKLRLGEIDAGIAYVTDVAHENAFLEAIPIEARFNVEATYPIAVLAGPSRREGGERFLVFVTSPEGRAILERHGFGAP